MPEPTCLTATDKVATAFPFTPEVGSSNPSFGATTIAPAIFGVAFPRLLYPSVSLQTLPPLIIIPFVVALFVCTIEPPPRPFSLLSPLTSGFFFAISTLDGYIAPTFRLLPYSEH
ncbi:hypothetical protein LX36DRAFT_657967 [Colletotrichum falcatum]|nr:hypothetical protein LX36DRAFT_657967 [Colletotrichum falcatum]